MRERTILAQVALAALFWGANFNLAGPVLAAMSPLQAAAGRFGLAALLMLAVVWVRREPLGPALLRSWHRYALLGLVGIGGFNILFFAALMSTSAVNGALIMATNPLVTAALAAALLGEQPTSRQWLAMPVAVAGVAVVVLGGGRQLGLATGDVLMLCANLCWALYNVLTRRLMPKEPTLINTAALMLVGALALTAAAGIEGQALSAPGVSALLSLAAMASFGTVLAYLFWNTGIAHLGAARTALFLNLVPVCTMVINAFGGAVPSGLQLVGGAVVIAAVTASMTRPRPVLAAAAAE